jgi:protocatechuate 4,5-dioxygenase alpha chain
MDGDIGGTIVFTGERSRAGYRLNRMAMSLTDAANRERFVADEEGYTRGMGLDDAERAMVRRRDWKAMIEAGGSIYLVIKIAGALGVALYDVGAHTAGMTLEQFMATRKGQ